MTVTNNLRKGLDKKIWQPMSICPVINATAMFVINNPAGWDPEIMYITSTTVIYLYNCQEDGWIRLPSSAAGGTFGAGVCGSFHPRGPNGTATAGSTTTITTNLTINISLAGFMVRITAGPNAGQDRIILSNTLGTNSIITVQAYSTPITNASTYTIMSGRYWFFNAGTLSASSFRYYDRATNAWSSISITNLPAAWGTDGRLVNHAGFRTSRDLTPPSGNPIVSATVTTVTTTFNFVVNQLIGRMITIISGTGVGQSREILSNTATIITTNGPDFSPVPDATSKYLIEGLSGGLATAFGATTLTDDSKTWTTSQWINFQVRIVNGTGAGQVRVITANTGTQLTVAAWTTNPDVTTVYLIEGDDNTMYLLGNNAITLYKYSISGNTWSTLAPGVARAGAPGAGMSTNIIFENTSPAWTNESAIINGRRIYSFRGTATGTLDYYDIAANTWTNGISNSPATETFTTGQSWDVDNGIIYGSIAATNTHPRFFAFNPSTQYMIPIGTLMFADSTATLGDKMWLWTFVEGNTQLKFLYYLNHTLQNLWRTLLI